MRDFVGIRQSLTPFILVLALGAISCDKSEISEIEKSKQLKKTFIRSDSPQPKKVKINKHILMIPNYYIANVSKRNEFVSLRTNWPNLTSRFQLNADKFKPNRFDSIEIILSGSRNIKSLRSGDYYKNLINNLRFKKPIYNGKLDLWEYKYKLSGLSNRVYVSVKNGVQTPYGQPLSISCDGGVRIKNDPGSIQCHVDYLIRNDIAVTYRFFKKHIHDWKLIDSKVRTMIESYLQEEK